MISQKELKQRYLSAALKFINKLNDRNKIIAVFLTGSYYNNKLTENSDIDMFVITKQSKFREKGIAFVNDIKIGYFINPIEKIYQLLYSEMHELKRPTCEMIHFSECIYSIDEQKKSLKELARSSITTKLPRLKKKEQTYIGWKISDKLSTVEKWNKQSNKPNYEYSSQDLFTHIINAFFLYNRKYIPNTKYVLENIQKIDKEFYKQTTEYLLKKEKYKLIILAKYILEKLDFSYNMYGDRNKI